MGQLSDIKRTGREQQQPFQEHVAEIAEDSISAAWLCEPYLHGEEASHFLRLDLPLLSIPCTPFGEYTHKMAKSTC